MNFREGQIIKMDVASRSHVSKPYYVEVIFYNPYASKKGDIVMETWIPGQHRCVMKIGNNWEYHYPRMTIIGDKEKYYHLLLNQDLT